MCIYFRWCHNEFLKKKSDYNLTLYYEIAIWPHVMNHKMQGGIFFTVIFRLTPVGFPCLSHTFKWTLMNWQRTQKDASTAVSTAVDWLIRENTLPANFHENIHSLCWLIRRLLPERANSCCHRGLVVDVFAFTPQANGSRAWDWPILAFLINVFTLMCSHLPKWTSLTVRQLFQSSRCERTLIVEVALIGDCSYIL